MNALIPKCSCSGALTSHPASEGGIPQYACSNCNRVFALDPSGIGSLYEVSGPKCSNCQVDYDVDRHGTDYPKHEKSCRKRCDQCGCPAKYRINDLRYFRGELHYECPAGHKWLALAPDLSISDVVLEENFQPRTVGELFCRIMGADEFEARLDEELGSDAPDAMPWRHRPPYAIEVRNILAKERIYQEEKRRRSLALAGETT